MAGLERWLLFLGAGASRPDPCDLPPFGPLSNAILESIGWERRTLTDHSQGDRANPDPFAEHWSFTKSPHYPDIAQLDTAAEVLFGTLNTFGVDFAKPVCDALRNATPNAVHELAANVLRAGGCVWTPNIDDAVERACRDIGFHPHRTGRTPRLRNNPLDPLRSSTEGTYVKFHGTVERPETLAFTDRQLLAPLASEDLEHLARLAEGRVVVLHGYAGADADLAELLERIVTDADDVRWFEPNLANQQLIGQAFQRVRSRIQFRPQFVSPDDLNNPFGATGYAFLQFAGEYGHVPDTELRRLLIEGRDPPRKLDLRLRKPSGATQARLVERFGASDSDDDKLAWDKAWHYDLSHIRIPSFRQHLRHRINYSLYHDGKMAHITRWLADRRDLLERIRPRRLRDYFITRACALIMRTGSRDYLQLGDFVDWAVQTRTDHNGSPYPSDLYYQAQSQRYALRPTEARRTAERVIDGLVRRTDLERLAGALYEAGDTALYQADFNAALDYAFDLRYRRGRYAIARWQAWARVA